MVGLGYVADRQAEIRSGMGHGILHVVIIEKLSMFISQTEKISTEDALSSTNVSLPYTLVVKWANSLSKEQKQLSEQTRLLVSIHKLTSLHSNISI